jgi:signal transduction histidine kinase
MQAELRAALKQKDRLAALGAAVAKVNHDLRNSLSTAVLISDRLANIEDPEVKKVTPKLYDAIDRAVNLCSQTLNYVRDRRPKLDPQPFFLRELVAELGAALHHDWDPEGFAVDNAVPMDLDFTADRDHLFRALFNLANNARQAGATHVRLAAERVAGAGPDGDAVVIDVTDDGPGIDERAREQLFKPFEGSTKKGGAGLGLIIVRDIARAHGGTVELAETGPGGTTFRLSLPAGPDLS